MALHYIIGDATDPIKKPAIICHVCNDCQPGKWGAGFVIALSKKNSRPEQYYRDWANKGEIQGVKYALGNVQTAPFTEDVIVANIIGQHDTKPTGNRPPVRYWAIAKGLKKIAKYANEKSWSIHMPRIGSKLAGGAWDEIEYILKQIAEIVEVYVYTLPSEKEDWPDCVYENVAKADQ